MDATCIGLYVLAAAYMIASIIKINDGTFTYTLDDPYIHLALAENIARGHYGVNLNETSAPSSSIIFPLILAIGEITGTEHWTPLFINLFCGVLNVHFLALLLRRYILSLKLSNNQYFLFFVLVLAACLNLVGVAFTGMEHSLHLLATLIVLTGLVSERARAPWWLVATLCVQPLIRFEGMAITAAAIGILLFRDRRAAIIVTVIVAGILGAYAAVMAAAGLPALPSSVLAKSQVAKVALETYSPTDTLLSAIRTAFNNTIDGRGTVLLALLFLTLLKPLRTGNIQPATPEFAVATLSAATITLHLAAGRVGIQFRYELYAMAVAFLSALFVWRHEIRKWITDGNKASLYLVLLVMALASSPYLAATRNIPLAANNIFQQQYQMHRFVKDFLREPVAVNDLGLVSYRNDNYVLDLLGLAFEPARKLRSNHLESAEQRLAQFAADRQIRLAMIYSGFFEGYIPSTWQRLARLRLGRRKVSAASAVVDFYATSKYLCAAFLDLFLNFRRDLPDGVTFEIADCPQIDSP